MSNSFTVQEFPELLFDLELVISVFLPISINQLLLSNTLPQIQRHKTKKLCLYVSVVHWMLVTQLCCCWLGLLRFGVNGLLAGRGCLWLCISSTHLSHHLQATVECSYADGIHAKRISSFSSSVYIMYTNPLLVQEGSSVIISGHNPSSVQSCHSRTCLKSFLPHP